MATPKNPVFLETRSIGRLLFEFSTPAVVACLVTATYNLVARIFVAQRFGIDGVTALTVSFPVIVCFLAVAMTIGTGATILISIHLGERKNDKAEEALGQALYLSVVTAAIFVFFGELFLEPILRFVGASDAILPLAKSYLSVVMWGVLPQHIAFGVNNFIRAEGRPKTAMVSMLISAFANGFLDYLFLFVFKTGIWGAGVANIIACTIAAGWVSGLYFTGYTALKWRWKYFKFNWKLTKDIAICGAVPFAAQACSAILQTTSNNLMGHYGDLYGEAMGYSFDGGDLAIGIMGTVVAIANMFMMPFFGMGQGVQPIVGYNSGANRPDRVLETIRTAIRFAFYTSFVMWAFLMLKPEWFVRFFLNAGEVGFKEKLALGMLALRGVMLALPLITVNILVSGYFQAQGRPILALMLTLLRQLLLLLPTMLLATWLMQRYLNRGLTGFWFSFPLADLFSYVLSLVFLFGDYKRKRVRIAELAPEIERRKYELENELEAVPQPLVDASAGDAS